MDKQAQIPVTLPRADPTRAFWQDPADAVADLRSTPELPARADVVIIGSGITGAAVAWNLLGDTASPAPGSIVMLEARQASSGATGRNGGHTKAASYRSFMDHVTELGMAAAVQIARLELANIRAVHGFAAEHGIACDSNPCQTVDVIYDGGWWAAAHEAVAAMRAAMPGDDAAEYAFCSADEVRDEFHCAGADVCGGLRYFAGSISAYRFTTGVLRLCLARGLNLQTHTPAVELARGGDGWWAVKTPRGTIAARRVVVATNGYTAALVKELQGSVVPLRGQIAMHRPGHSMPAEGLATTYSFIYEKGYEYMVPRPRGAAGEGDLVMGGGLAYADDDGGTREFGTTDDTALNPSVSAYLRDSAPRYFGDSWGDDHPDGRIRCEWTGIMGYTADGRPFVGEMPGQQGGGLWVACAFVGHGMVYSWMCARALVEMMQGRDGAGLAAWFPDSFRLTSERMEMKFHGRVHTSAAAAAAAAAAAN